MILILFCVIIASALYFLHLNYSYWTKRGVPGPKPILLVGNILENFLLKKSLPAIHADIYKKYENAPLVGLFKSGTPTLIVRDPDLIKDLTVKSFQNFHDNELSLDKNVDPIAGRNPFFMKGKEWKSTRVILTPGFTSGKMKTIYPLLEDVCRKFVTYIANHPTGKGVKAKEVCMRFTLNNVGSCAFGLDAKCFDEDNPEFKQIADDFLTPEGLQTIKMFIISVFPFLTKFTTIKIVSDDVTEKLRNIVTQAMKYRDDHQIVRNDFLQILMQLHKNDPNFTEIDATAQAASFFVDGYETSSIVMHFVLFELAANLDAQERLREEVTQAFEENHDTLPHEKLHELSYLDAVFNETLRLHPPLGSLNKICTKAYTYVPKEGDVIKEPFVIEPNTIVSIPLFGIQRDPKYFEDPDSFKPERFLDPSNITKYTFLPFGEGPRACLGQRFGILQVKIGIAYVIKNFRISVNGKTKLPIEYDPMYFLTLPKNAIWLDFEKI